MKVPFTYTEVSVIVWIFQLSPRLTTPMAISNVAFALKTRCLDGFVGMSTYRLYPDPGTHPFHELVTRWSLMICAYSTRERACNAMSEVRAYQQNKIRNVFNEDLEAAGLVALVATTDNW